jgi:hypothetical protein
MRQCRITMELGWCGIAGVPRQCQRRRKYLGWEAEGLTLLSPVAAAEMIWQGVVCQGPRGYARGNALLNASIGAVAFTIVTLLSVELILQVGSSAGYDTGRAIGVSNVCRRSTPPTTTAAARATVGEAERTRMVGKGCKPAVDDTRRGVLQRD